MKDFQNLCDGMQAAGMRQGCDADMGTAGAWPIQRCPPPGQQAAIMSSTKENGRLEEIARFSNQGHGQFPWGSGGRKRAPAVTGNQRRSPKSVSGHCESF